MKTFIFILLVSCLCYPQMKYDFPSETSQLVIVLTETISSSSGKMNTYERTDDGKWKSVKTGIPVLIGKNGLAWGGGLDNFNTASIPVKKEGDGCSPAGMFRLGPAFGFNPPEAMKHLRVPYREITEMIECIDDTSSRYYNELVDRSSVKADWNSSEKMKAYGKWYEQGIIIEYNKNPETRGAGSCIFIHNWVHPDETTTGCTEMNPMELKNLIEWLDSSRNPMIIQLPRSLLKYITGLDTIPGNP